ncbi:MULTISPECIES: hypothetical protein [Halorussus]|nr:hypothetical protein [Halorussus vallis]
MEKPRDAPPTRKGAVQHLENALAETSDDEVKYHIREALQLLGIE